MERIQIKTVDKLKDLSKNGIECFILLSGGLRSSKYIRYDKDKKSFYVFNYIDGTDQLLTQKQLLDRQYCNISEAMEKGSLIAEVAKCTIKR